MGARGDFEGMTGKVITTQLRTAMLSVRADPVLRKPMEHRSANVSQIPTSLRLKKLKTIWIVVIFLLVIIKKKSL